MIFDGDIPQNDHLAQLYGIFVLCRNVYNARKINKTFWNKEENIFEMTIDLNKENVRPKRAAQFNCTIQINDSSYPSTCFRSTGC